MRLPFLKGNIMNELAYRIPWFLYNHKIIDFNKLSLKKLKKIYAIVISLIAVILLIGTIFPSLTADDYSDGLTNDFTDQTISGTTGQTENIAFNLTEAIGDTVSTGFAPGLSTFMGMFGVDFSDNILVSNFATETFETNSGNVIVDTVLVFGIVAYVISTSLFIIGLIRAAVVAPFENVDAPKVIIFKYIKALILISVSQQLLAPILLISQTIFNYMASADDTSMGTAVATYTSVAGGALQLIPAIGAVLKLILLYVVLKEFIKLNVEIIERYMMSCFLYMFSCIGFAFSASSLTERITTSFLTMYVTELFLLILNQFFIKTTLILMTTSLSLSGEIVGALHPFTTTFALLAWMRIGQHIDENLKGLGLSVARTGGNLIDSVVGAGMALYGSMSKMSKSATNAAGSILSAQGMANSDPGKLSLGSTLKGKPMNKEQAETAIMNESFTAAKNMPVRDAQVGNMFDGISNSAADKQFQIKSGEYMSRAFGSDWQEKIAGINGKVDAKSLSRASNGIISGIGTDKDGNNFDFAIANNGRGLTNSKPFSETLTGGTPWNIQYGQKGGFASIPNSATFNGKEGINNFLRRTSMSASAFKDLTGREVSDVSSITMANGSAKLNSSNGILGAIHNIGGTYKYSDTSTASAFGTKGVDRSSELTAGNAALQSTKIAQRLDSIGIHRPASPEGINAIHKSDIINPNTGELNGNFTKLDEDYSYYDNDSGLVYTKAIDHTDLNDDPMFVETTRGEAEKIIDEYNQGITEDSGLEPLSASNTHDEISVNDDDIDDYASKYKTYKDAYSQAEKDLINKENNYIMSELSEAENLSSVDDIDANEKIIHATSRERGPVTYSYRVVNDQGPDKTEKIIGGVKNHNMLAYKQVHNRRIQ